MTTITISTPLKGVISRDFLRSTMQVLGASLFLALCAQISFPLYFTPIPLSMHTVGIMIVGAFLGSHKGSLAVGAFLLQGILGLPVFAGGNSGLAYFVGSSMGYLLGFVLQAYLVGWWVEKKGVKRMSSLLFVLSLADLIVLGAGTLWMGFAWAGLRNAMVLGFYPFLVGDAIKITSVALYLRKRFT